MSDVQTLLAKCRDLGATFAPMPDGKLKVRAPAPLPDALRQELKEHKAEVLKALAQREAAFLSHYLPSTAQVTFPDWQGLLINSVTLGLAVWVVRSREDGKRLAQATGEPALMLDDVLSQHGQTREAARAALLPLLIMGTSH